MVEAQPWSLGQPEMEGHRGSNASIAKDVLDKLTPDMEANPSSADTETLKAVRGGGRMRYRLKSQES